MKVTQKNGLDQSEKNVFGQLWFKYFPYWPLFLILLTVALTGAWFYVRYKTNPYYEATASILIKDEKKGQDEAKMLESLNQLSAKKIIENEIEVIKSRQLLTEVAKKLHLYAPVYEKGRIKPATAYTTSPVIVQAQNPDSLGNPGDVYFSVGPDSKWVLIGNDTFTVNKWVRTPYGVLRFVPQAHDKMPKERPLYFNLEDPKVIATNLQANLQAASVSKLSSVISLKVKDENPKRAEDILNALIASYNEAALNDKNTLAANTLSFVNERLKYVEKDLDSIEQKLQQYKANQGAIDIGSQGTLFLQNVSELSQKIGDANVQMDVLNQVEKYVTSKDKTGGIVPSTVGVEDPILTKLLNDLYQNEMEYEKQIKTTGVNNPIVLSLRSEIDKMKPSILENIRNQKASLEASRNNLNSLNNRYSSLLSSIPQKERDLVEISRQQGIKSSVYNFLLQKKEETAMALSSSIADSRTVDNALSFGPMSPAKKIYMMAVMAALVLGIGFVTANEMLKRTILFRHEIEAFTSVPVIGEIVHDESGEAVVIAPGKRTFIAEQFRNLRTSLSYLGIKNDKKRILVTSTVSGEGKSFVVANLAVSLAIAGKKVVVLEFDLSEPTLCAKLNFTNINKGITDYLQGNADPEEIIRRTTVHENLFVMPAGNELPDNPSELIVSGKVPELLNYLSDIFEYIIVDSAPVGLLSDAYVLSNHCDATIYVVRHKHTRKVSIQRLDANNKINELKNIGIVFNGVKSRGFSKNGYGYGYGYGYIYNEKRDKKGKKRVKKAV